MRKPVEIAQPPPRFHVLVRSIRLDTSGLLVLRTDAPPFSFSPGDCVSVFSRDGCVCRPYSFASAPGDDTAEFLVRVIPGGRVSSGLATLRPGDPLQISPPFGWFRPCEPAGADKVWLATGTGIAPFLSALRAGHPPPLHLWWGLRDSQDARLLDDAPWLRVFASPDRLTRHLSLLPQSGSLHVHLCGLDRMVEEACSFFQARGLPANQLHREVFFTAPG